MTVKIACEDSLHDTWRWIIYGKEE